jgi:cold-inducible RNA-binding protein
MEENKKKLFVGGLSYDTTDESLREFFSQAGNVESAAVIKDRMSGRSKGFGFVEMSSEEEAEKAVNTLNGQSLDGREVSVNVARPKVDNPMRGGGNGGGGRFDRRR